jgi:L-malate glycosyltransferase
MMDSLQTGGSERQFAALAQAIDRTAFRLHLGCIQKRGDFAGGLEELKEFPLGGSLYGTRSVGTRLSLGRHLRRCDVDIAHAFDFYTNLLLIPVARLGGVRVVIGSQRQLGDLLTPAQRRAQHAALRWSDCVVCNSRAAADRLIAAGLPAVKVRVIGNGLPAECFAAAAPALPRTPGVLRVGMIARMNLRAKNHGMLLRAAARLKGQFPTLELVFVGDGPLRPELEREAASLGIGAGVHFLGDRRDIPAVLASLDVSAMPSGSESLSNAILESMAAAVPVVAASVGGNPELIAQDRGLLFPPNDQESLTGGLAQLLRDARTRTGLGSNGRRFVLENFTIDRMRSEHQELYREMLARKGWRPRETLARRRDKSSGPIRVAIVAASLRYVGGQSAQAATLLRHWRDDGAIQAGFIPIDPDFPGALAWAERVPILRTLIRAPIYLSALRRGLKNADVAHIFAASYWSFLLAPAPACWVARRLGVRTLINYHSGEARDHLRRFRTARPVLARAGALVVPSQYLVDVFREFGLSAQAVPNIVDPGQFKFRMREPLRPRLICSRGFHRYYGVDVVVRAFALVRRAFPEATLCLLGDGETRSEVRGLCDHLKLEGVTFPGVASREEIGGFYDAADIFVNGSWLDNMPVSILEAFAAGTPVVSTAPEGIRYLVRHEETGMLSAVGDSDALAANAIRLLRDPELAGRLARNAHRECERYRWESVRGQWLGVYRSVFEAPGAEAARRGAATISPAPPAKDNSVERPPSAVGSRP